MEVLTFREALQNHLLEGLGLLIYDQPEVLEMCIKAIEAVNEGDIRREIPLPEFASSMNIRTGEVRTTTLAKSIVQKFQLYNFLAPDYHKKIDEKKFEQFQKEAHDEEQG